MFRRLQIYDRRERWMVGLADALLQIVRLPMRLRPTRPRLVRRVLLLRLERIGDLLMSLGPIAAVRDAFPDAHIDLVVGSWNASLASTIPGVDRVERLDVPWLARGARGDQWSTLLARAGAWRARGYDLAVNFEGDIRSHLLMARSGAPVRVGFDHAGGGPLLTHVVAFDPARHTAENGLALVRAAVAASGGGERAAGIASRVTQLHLSAAHLDAADRALRAAGWTGEPLVGVHVSGGRPVKQWEPARFGEAIAALATDHAASIVMTGTSADRAVVDAARIAMPSSHRVIDLVGDVDLLTLAAVLSKLRVFITGDTGPMHLAAAVGTPLVAIFGPSMPWRYGPLSPHARVVRIDLPCAPCNQIRLPPVRCRGVIPDCLTGVSVSQVIAAARDVAPSTDDAPASSTAP